MPGRLGRLQRQSRRAFRASTVAEVFASELAGWCWARQALEKGTPHRRIGHEWLWRLPDAVVRWC